jgi:rare lipoprotein A
VRSIKTARIPILLSLGVLLLSACADTLNTNFTPLPTIPSDDTYIPIPEWHPGCVERETYSEEGEASWYKRTKKMRKTASGEPLDPNAATAAHRYLPLGTKVKVTNLANGKSVTLTINDRGPYTKGRIIDVSQRSARDLGFLNQGITRVRIETTEPARSDC